MHGNNLYKDRKHITIKLNIELLFSKKVMLSDTYYNNLSLSVAKTSTFSKGNLTGSAPPKDYAAGIYWTNSKRYMPISLFDNNIRKIGPV